MFDFQSVEIPDYDVGLKYKQGVSKLRFEFDLVSKVETVDLLT